MENQKRVVIDCREHPGSNCSLRLSGTEKEVMQAAAQHAIAVHAEKEGPELQEMLKKALKDEKAAA